MDFNSQKPKNLWLKGQKPMLERRVSHTGTEACQAILRNRLSPMLCIARVSATPNEFAVPFFTEPGFHEAVRKVGMYLEGARGNDPNLDAFWVQMTVYQDPNVFLIEAGAVPCQTMPMKQA